MVLFFHHSISFIKRQRKLENILFNNVVSQGLVDVLCGKYLHFNKEIEISCIVFQDGSLFIPVGKFQSHGS